MAPLLTVAMDLDLNVFLLGCADDTQYASAASILVSLVVAHPELAFVSSQQRHCMHCVLDSLRLVMEVTFIALCTFQLRMDGGLHSISFNSEDPSIWRGFRGF